ncbi:zinc finger protein 385B-like [Hirundo rustica]|uniref:zinc finger protein 385B-like n=1 Tax=Hirundo rustica TaxID=43150 RepID=UPI001A93AC00|nr:zinc finger protein 385B-like [Hirundo rustica]
MRRRASPSHSVRACGAEGGLDRGGASAAFIPPLPPPPSPPPPPPRARSHGREREAGGRMLQTAAEPGGWAGMKRPLSPSHSPESAVQVAEEASCPPSQPEQRMKREKKHQSFTLCEVCNIQLNSAAQAQIHYNGKSHQKRLKQLNKGKMPAAQGRSPPSRSRLPKGCPCSGTSALLGSWRDQKCRILSLASVTCWPT